MSTRDLDDHAQRLSRDATEPVADILERVSDGVVALDKSWRYTYINSQAAGLFGRRPEDLIGRHIWTEFPEGVGQLFQLAYERAMAEQTTIELESYYEPWNRWFENRIYPSPDGLSIFFHEITERKLAEQQAQDSAQLLKGQNDVLELIARGAPLRDTLDLLLRVIERHCAREGMLGSILLVDSGGTRVRHGAAPSLPDAYTRAVDGQLIGPSAGSCGTAAHRREAVIVEDIATDPLWDTYRDLALAHELRACWSTPIFDAEREVLGTFALYFRTPRLPTVRHHELIDICTHTAAIAIVRDRETHALRTSEARLRLALKAGNIGTWEWSIRDDRFVSTFLWRTDSSAPPRTLDAALANVHPDDRLRVRATLQESVEQHLRFETECRALRPDGSVDWISAMGRTEYDIAGAPVRMIGVVLDITERKRVEEEIARRQAQLEEAQRIAHLGSYHWHVATNTVDRSEELCRIFGVHPDDFEPTFDGYLARVHPDDRAGTRRAVEQSFAARTPFSFEERIVRPDGSIRWLYSQGKWICDAAQVPVTLVGICQDITERKESEDQRRRSEEIRSKNQELELEVRRRTEVEQLLRERNEELKAFAYTVSHDLKAPLRGIAGYAQELDRRHRDGLSERALLCITHILTATHNLDRLIEDLLYYSRLDGETSVASRVDLRQLLQTILDDRRLAIVEREVDVAMELGATHVLAWERGLTQVLTNLIDNALKYSRDARPARLRLTSEAHDDSVRISIADNGIGFNMNYHDRIFGLFNRLVRQEEFEGTGAGLAIARKLVEKMKGRLWAQSAPGAGAVFHVELAAQGSTPAER